MYGFTKKIKPIYEDNRFTFTVYEDNTKIYRYILVFTYKTRHMVGHSSMIMCDPGRLCAAPALNSGGGGGGGGGVIGG